MKIILSLGGRRLRVGGGSNLIKFMLADRGVTLVDVGEEAGVDPATVSQILSGRKKSRPIIRVIASKLKLPVKTVEDILATR